MSARLHLRVGRGSVSAKAVQRKRVVWAGQAAFTGPDDLREVIAQLATEDSLPVRIGSLRVKLEAPLAQVRTLEGLPPVRAPALRALVEHQAPRFFRKNGKPLITDAVWMPRGRGSKAVARAAAAEEPWIEAITAAARETGLRLEAIRPAGEGASLRRLSLALPGERARQRRAELLQLRRLAAVAALLWTIAAAAFGIRVRAERLAIERELAALSRPAAAVSEARRKLGDAARMVETIESAERGRTELLRQLAATAAALPDSAYLTSLSLQGQTGSMSGLAPQATAVVAAFERQPGVVSNVVLLRVVLV